MRRPAPAGADAEYADGTVRYASVGAIAEASLVNEGSEARDTTVPRRSFPQHFQVAAGGW